MMSRGDGANETPSSINITNSEFLEELFKGAAPGEAIWVAHFIGDPNQTRGEWLGRPYDRNDHARMAADDPGWGRQNTYFAVSSIKPGADGRLARRVSNIGTPLAVVVDDADTSKLNGVPSWVFETSPGKFQIGVFLDVDCPYHGNVALFDALIRRMTAANMMGQDKSGNNSVRYVRLPVGMNLKPAYGPSCRVQVRAWNPGQRLGLEDAAAVFGVDLDEVINDLANPVSRQIEYTADRPGGASGRDAESRELTIAELAHDIVVGVNYHDATMRLAASLVACGTAGGAAVNFVRGLMDASTGPRDDRWTERWKDIPRLVRQAEEKFKRELEPPKPRAPALSPAALGLPTVAELTDLTVGLGLPPARKPGGPGSWVEPSQVIQESPVGQPVATSLVPGEDSSAQLGPSSACAPTEELSVHQRTVETLGAAGVASLPGAVSPVGETPVSNETAAPAWVMPSVPAALVPAEVSGVTYFRTAWEMASDTSNIDWLVEGFLESNCLSMLFGPSGSGKTFVGLDLGMAISRGVKWNGHAVKQGLVVYVAGEGHGGLSRRIRAYKKHHKLTDEEMKQIPFVATRKAVQINDPDSVMELVEKIEEAMRRWPGIKLEMVQIDTLNRNFGEGDENTQKDVTKFFSNIDQFIRTRFGCHVMVVHHTGHNMDRARGSSVMKATLDQEFYVRPEGKNRLSLTCKKMKDGEEPPIMMFDITQVVLVEDSVDAAAQTSAVITLHGDPLDQVMYTTKLGKNITIRDVLELSKQTRDKNMQMIGAEVDIPKTTLQRLFKKCAETGLLIKKNNTGKHEDAYYEISEGGVVKASKDGNLLPMSKKTTKRLASQTPTHDEDDVADAPDQAGEDDVEDGSDVQS